LFSRGWRWTPHSIPKKGGAEEVAAVESKGVLDGTCLRAARPSRWGLESARPRPSAAVLCHFEAALGLRLGGSPSSFETMG
jgi:hypothetical protein